MTVYYVDSAAGSNTAPYDTWAKAATTLATITAIDAAGDTVYVASTHAESQAGAISLDWSGTLASPTRVICADKTSGAPPATIATGASVTSTTNNVNPNSLAGKYVYFYGISFFAGSSGGVGITLNAGIYADQCSFQCTAAGGTSFGFQFQGPGFYRNCTWKLSGTKTISANANSFIWSGGSFLSGSATPSPLFPLSGGSVIVENFDFSNLASSLNLAGLTGDGHLIFRKCKLPASWSGSLVTSNASSLFGTVELINCDNAATNYIYHRNTLFGDVTQETTLVRSGGASDGTTPISWKMVSGANILFPIEALRSAEMEIWNNSTSSVTVTVEYLHDSLTGLKNNEIWIEVRYPKDTGDPLGDIATSAPDVLAAGTTNTASSATWTTTGMTNPNAQKMAVTFTPRLAGPVFVTVCMTKASYTAYVDPLITLS